MNDTTLYPPSPPTSTSVPCTGTGCHTAGTGAPVLGFASVILVLALIGAGALRLASRRAE